MQHDYIPDTLAPAYDKEAPDVVDFFERCKRFRIATNKQARANAPLLPMNVNLRQHMTNEFLNQVAGINTPMDDNAYKGWFERDPHACRVNWNTMIFCVEDLCYTAALSAVGTMKDMHEKSGVSYVIGAKGFRELKLKLKHELYSIIPDKFYYVNISRSYAPMRRHRFDGKYLIPRAETILNAVKDTVQEERSSWHARRDAFHAIQNVARNRQHVRGVEVLSADATWIDSQPKNSSPRGFAEFLDNVNSNGYFKCKEKVHASSIDMPNLEMDL